MPETLAATLIVAFLIDVASKMATSAEPGVDPVDQLAPSDQLLVIPTPVQVIAAAPAGPVNVSAPPTTIRRTRPERGGRTGVRTLPDILD